MINDQQSKKIAMLSPLHACDAYLIPEHQFTIYRFTGFDLRALSTCTYNQQLILPALKLEEPHLEGLLYAMVRNQWILHMLFIGWTQIGFEEAKSLWNQV